MNENNAVLGWSLISDVGGVVGSKVPFAAKEESSVEAAGGVV